MGWSREVPFFRLQMSQAPGIRRFFEWVSDDGFEASSPFDSAIAARSSGSMGGGASTFQLMTHQIDKLPKMDQSGTSYKAADGICIGVIFHLSTSVFKSTNSLYQNRKELKNGVFIFFPRVFSHAKF